jgi:hypothetical protein
VETCETGYSESGDENELRERVAARFGISTKMDQLNAIDHDRPRHPSQKPAICPDHSTPMHTHISLPCHECRFKTDIACGLPEFALFVFGVG